MPTPQFSNNASSTLAVAITTTTTSLTLAAGTGAKFPALSGGNWFMLTLYSVTGVTESLWEIVKCTARSGDVLTVVRAQEGTTASSWSIGTPVELRLTASVASDLVTEVYTGIPSYLDTKAPLANAALTTPGISGGTLSGTVATLTTPLTIDPAGGALPEHTNNPQAVVLTAPTVDGNPSACFIGPLLNPSPTAANDYTLVVEAVTADVAWRNISLARYGGCVLVGTQANILEDATYRLQVNGKAYVSSYMQIGPPGSPTVATKKLTGTTPSTQGGLVAIAHGLTASKILTWNVVVNGVSTSDLIPQQHMAYGYEFTSHVNSDNIVVALSATNSANILNKGIKVFVVYEE